MSRRQNRLRPRGESGTRPLRRRRTDMPKYLLLKHYSGVPSRTANDFPMDEWTPDEITAHMAFQNEVARMLEENGEYVDAQALSPTGAWVQYGGPDTAPVVLDGPFPET